MIGENATLLDISAPGALDKYRKATGVGAVQWSGRAPVALKSTHRRVVSAGNVTRVEIDVLIIRRVTGVPVTAIVAGDEGKGSTVLVEDRRGPAPVKVRYRVVATENRSAGTSLDSARLELADERPG